MRGKNASGAGAASDEFTATPAPAPGAPTALTVTAASATAIGLSWTAPVDTYGDMDGYNVYRCDNSTPTCTPAWLAWNTTTTYSDSAVTANTEYRYAVSAVRGLEGSAWSNVVTATAQATVILTATAVTETTATLNVTGHTAAWWYKGDQTNASCTSVAASTATANLSGLTGGTAYTYKAYSDSGCTTEITSASTDAEFTTLPGKVAGLAAAPGAGASLDLSWSAVTGATGYRVQWRSSADTGWDAADRQTTATATAKALAALARNTTYAVRVAATNAQGAGAWSDAASATTASGRVSGLRVAAGNASLELSWDVQAGATGYKAQWRSTAQDWDTGNRQAASTTASTTLAGLTNGTDYLVRVAAVFAAGDAPWSDEAAGRPVALPSLLRVSGVTAAGATLTMSNTPGANNWWLKGAGGGGYAFACTQVTSAGGYALTGLSGNTSYVFQAFNRSNCPDTSVLATAYFTTPGNLALAAHTVTKDSAVLELHGHDGRSDWSYRVEMVGLESGRSCYAVRRGSSVSFGPLRADTAYTAQAFRGLTCQAVERMASVTFTTRADDTGLPVLSATNVAATRATLALANHAGEWFHDVDRDAATCARVAAGTATAMVTGLDENTNYTVTAYSDPRCSAATESVDWESAATFTTTGPASVSVTSKTATTFTVAVAGYTAANGFPANWSISAWRPRGDGGFEGSACQTFARATTTATVTGLKAGLAYTVSVYRGNSCSLASDAFSDTAATTSLSANAGATSAALTLDHHQGDWSYRGGATAGGAAGAAAQSTAGNDATHRCQAMAAGAYTARLDGLEADTAYAYTAYAGPACAGAELGRAAFTTPPPARPPAAPAGLAATPGDASATLAWDDPADASITGYEYQVNHDDTDTGRLSGWGEWTAVEGSGADTASYTVTGLANGREYRFRLRARNGAGTSPNAPRADPWYVAAVPRAAQEPGEAPEVPASVTVTRSDGALHASWPAVAGATSYHITYTSDNGTSWSLAAENHTETSITITGVDNALTYIVGARARNGHGDSGWTNSPAAGPFTPEPADPPGTVPAVTVTRGDGTLNASWPAVAGATSYHVTYSGDHGASWRLAALHHPDTRITITGVDNALTYLVGVRARNEHGDGGWRNSPPAGPDTGKDGAGTALPDEPPGAAAPAKTNLAPAFEAGATLPDLSYEQGTLIEPLALPAATGGDAPLRYALQPALPQGMNFDATTRVLSGTPETRMKAARYTYTVTDADGDTAQLYFRLAATPFGAGAGRGVRPDRRPGLPGPRRIGRRPARPGRALPRRRPDNGPGRAAGELVGLAGPPHCRRKRPVR